MNQNPDIPPSFLPTAGAGVSPQPEKPRRRTWLVVYAIVVTILLFLGGALVLVLLMVHFAEGLLEPAPLAKSAHKRPYQEAVLGGQEWSNNKIGVIYLTGVISYSTPLDISGRVRPSDEEGMVGELKAQLRQASEDKDVKAVLIRMDTPGGEVTAADDLYHEVSKVKKTKPVVISMASLAASGGYYVAAAANHIVASETTLTGSIGVIVETLTFEKALAKIGVKPVIFKSGKFKDILTPMREPTDEEAKLVQDLVMGDYERFLDVVAHGRMKAYKQNPGAADVEEFKKVLRNGLADGRILTGRQAKEGKLVDSLGYFDDAVEKAKEIAGIKDAKLIQYYRPVSLRDLLGLSMSTAQQRIRLEFSLGASSNFHLEPGKRYYLHESYALP